MTNTVNGVKVVPYSTGLSGCETFLAIRSEKIWPGVALKKRP